MTGPAVTITPDESVEHAAQLMYNCRVRRLPVVDGDGRLIGIVSRADVLAVFDRTDEQIGEDVDQVISHEFQQDPSRFTVTVRSGVVTLQGSPETAKLGRDIMRKVRHVQGVVAVRDRLSYPPDQTAQPGTLGCRGSSVVRLPASPRPMRPALAAPVHAVGK